MPCESPQSSPPPRAPPKPLPPLPTRQSPEFVRRAPTIPRTNLSMRICTVRRFHICTSYEYINVFAICDFLRARKKYPEYYFRQQKHSSYWLRRIWIFGIFLHSWYVFTYLHSTYVPTRMCKVNANECRRVVLFSLPEIKENIMVRK